MMCVSMKNQELLEVWYIIGPALLAIQTLFFGFKFTNHMNLLI